MSSGVQLSACSSTSSAILFEQTKAEVRLRVLQNLVLVAHADVDAQATGASARLQSLYTLHVLPVECMELWNNGLGRTCHRIAVGSDPELERPRVVQCFVQWICTHLLHVNSHSSFSRFFTFRACLDRMLTMYLVGMPEHVLQLRSLRPRKENSKRLKEVYALQAFGGTATASTNKPQLAAHRQD